MHTFMHEAHQQDHNNKQKGHSQRDFLTKLFSQWSKIAGALQQCEIVHYKRGSEMKQVLNNAILKQCRCCVMH